MAASTSYKVFYFSQVNVFIIAYHLCKIYLQSERKAWIYLSQNFRIFIQKKKSCALKVAVLEFQK